MPMAPMISFSKNKTRNPKGNAFHNARRCSKVMLASPYAVLSITHKSLNSAGERISPILNFVSG